MGWVSTLISQRKVRLWGIAAILVVTMAALAGGIATGATATCDNPNVASIQTLPGSSFEIDINANLKVDDPDCIDWLTGPNETDPFRAGVDWKRDTPSGSLDESFGEGTKEDTANPTIVNGSIPPNKSDLKAFGLYSEDLAGTDGTLALFWSRVQDPSGTTNMDFELNQKFCGAGAPASNCAGNGVTPVRTGNGQNTAGPDDILITYDLSRGGSQATISIRYWTGSAWGPANPIANATGALGTINSTKINSSPIDVPPGNPVTSLDPRTFGEAAVTFDALFGDNQCGSFGSAYLKSRSSDSFTAALKDFVPPEQVNVSNCPAALTTDATDSATLGAAAPNNQIRDTATLDVPAGTNGSIQFKLYGPFANAAAITPSSCTADKLVSGATSTTTVTNFNPASPTYNSALFTPTLAGTYNWTAQFTSTTPGVDSTGVVGCGVALEQSVVNKDTPAIVTNASASVTLGASIKDTATLSSGTNPTGTITFKLYDSLADCNANTDVKFTDTATVNGNGSYDSDPYTPTAAGTYYWLASYGGDDNNLGVSGKCDDANEQSVVGKKQPAISTSATEEAIVGDPIKDTATLTGATDNATGTITFKLYDSLADCNANTDVKFTDTATVNGNGSYDSDPFTPTAAGTFYWLASYGGDSNNLEVSGLCDDANEQTLVLQKQPTITTNATASVTIDSPISDTATLSGATDDATGTITFKLYSDAACTNEVDTGLQPVDIGSPNASGDYVVNSGNFTPTAIGTYYWIASYSGDDKNLEVSGECGDANESSVVEKAPANIETAQELFPQDSATLSATAGGTPTGTVTFKLYGPNNPTCSESGAAPVYTESDVTLTNGTANTDNTSFSVDEAKSGNYNWLVTYSGDEDHNGATSACGKEAFTATVDDDTTNN